jgi:primase-polymerase (primpol)-like protein
MNCSSWILIPQDLRDRPQWAVAGPDKSPWAVGGYRASCTDPATWATFDQASAAAERWGAHVGYMLTALDPFCCIDLDVKGNTPAELIAWHQGIVEGFDSYTEISASGRGRHIWVRAKIGAGMRRGSVEVYSQERFIVCTGDVIHDCPIAHRHELLSAMVNEMRGDSHVVADLPDGPQKDSDELVIDRAMRASNAGKFAALARGEWQQLGYPSQSEADLSLISMLTFYSPNNEQCRRIFRMTELGKREKATKDDRYLNLTMRRPRANQARMAAASRAMGEAILLNFPQRS